MHWSLRSWNISEREYPEKHQTKQANEDDEQEDWAQKETFSVEVCQRWNRGDKVQLEDESGFRLCCELVILCTGKAAPQGKEGNIASDKVRWRKRLSYSQTCSDQHQPRRGEPLCLEPENIKVEIESDRQSSCCVSDRNRDCQRSLRASWRKQQVCKRLNMCENPCLGTDFGAKSARRTVDAHLACTGDCWHTL